MTASASSKNYYWGMTPGGTKVNYIAKTDVSADDMYYRARIKGPISNMPDVPGLCVQLPGHIGVYIGGGQVIESTRGVFWGRGSYHQIKRPEMDPLVTVPVY